MIYVYLINLLTALFNMIIIEQYLHVYQLKDYNLVRFIRYFKKYYWFYCLSIIIFVLECVFYNWIFIMSANACLLVLNILLCSKIISSNKTPLKYTAKIKRLIIICAVIVLVLNSFSVGASLSNALIMFTPIIANFLNIYDKLKNKRFIHLAQEKLTLNSAKIIAITGSNGKTSVKNILYNLLKTKYKVLCSPKSYNTPLGISKFINESNVNECDFVILEYGARHIGDVKKLCNTFGADYGIITTIAPQHIESFKTIENVCIAKKELSDFLKYDLCVYNLDNIYTLKMYQQKTGKKLGVSIHYKCDIFASNIKIKDYKTEFNINFNNKKCKVKTRLLGRHNVTNILLASALATKLGVDIENIVDAISELNFVPHRLELIKTNINILDDSYNCSIASSREALYVLTKFSGKKVVATPGIIEGGKSEFMINFHLGELLSVCDEVIIIGNHNKLALATGLGSKNFKNIVYCPTLLDAQNEFKKLNIGDNLLLLNDLPDDYK